MLTTIEDTSKLATRMQSSESGKSTFKLCVGIASIILEGRLIGDEDSSSFDAEKQDTFAKTRESMLEKFCKDKNLFGFQRNDVKRLSTCVSSLNTASTMEEFEKNINFKESSGCDSMFPSTSTSTPKKLNLSYIHVDWEEYDNSFDGPREQLRSPEIPKYSTFHSKLERIKKSSSSSSVPSSYQNTSNKSSNSKQQAIKQGPHCESFLKKMTILKDNLKDVEHICSYSNVFCRRWQSNLQHFLQILSRNEIPCIEVFIGPEQNSLLLEVWTFNLNKSSSSPGLMTIQSLCCAIRSQLYFSQISSWIDLLKKEKGGSEKLIPEKSSQFISDDKTQSAFLDIFFRIKSYDGIDLFREKPLVHNFPETRLSDSLTINISLKSLPRLEKNPIFIHQNSTTSDFIDKPCLPNKISNSKPDDSNRLSDLSRKGRRESFSGKSSFVSNQQTKNLDNSFTEFSEQAINDVFPPLYQSVISDDLDSSNESKCLECESRTTNGLDKCDVFNSSNDTSTSSLSNIDTKSTLSSINEHQNVQSIRLDSPCCSTCFSSISNRHLAYDSCDNSIIENRESNFDRMKVDCRQCKRRKVRHHSNFFKGKSNRRTMSECLVGNYPNDESDIFESSLPGCNYEFPLCDKNVGLKIEESILNFNELNAYRRAFSDDVINQSEDYSLDARKASNLKLNFEPEHQNKLGMVDSLLTEKNNNISNYKVNNFIKPPCLSQSKSMTFKKFIRKTGSEVKRLQLLGSFEESLIQNRFQPKTTVNGFKALLGASGSFCPSQLTLPAQTKFYEFQSSENMSTPYVCEFRLPRKGYSLPRAGQLNVTLLNPQGIVVRMFFVTYDLRDMPTMSQTFIRQRMLATDDSTIQRDVDKMSCAEQMKLMRYSIHLRFQTSKSGRLSLHKDVKIIVSRKTEQDTAQAHARNSLESFSDLKIITVMPIPKYSSRIVGD